MRYDPDHWLSQELKKCVDHLIEVCDHADADCPSEYRTKWFNPSIKNAYDYVDGLYKSDVLRRKT